MLRNFSSYFVNKFQPATILYKQQLKKVSSSSSPVLKPVLGERASTIKTFSNQDVQTFAELTGDDNPLHFDHKFVNQSGVFQKPIVHGALVNGLVSGVIGTQLPGPGSVVVEQSSRFLAPLYVGDTVRVEVIITSIKKRFLDLAIECINMDAEEEKKVMLGKVTVMMTKKN
ncbi:(R)-specific enoyl-CoA hydratase-like [Styela clava]